jgi:hypothetical protein
MVSKEDAMLELRLCADLLVGVLNWLRIFLQSDAGHLLFALIAITRAIQLVRAIIYYCARSPYREARELASAMVVALVLGLLIAVTG